MQNGVHGVLSFAEARVGNYVYLCLILHNKTLE